MDAGRPGTSRTRTRSESQAASQPQPRRLETKRTISVNGKRQYSLRLIAIAFFAVMAIIVVTPTFARYLDRQQEVAQAKDSLIQAKDSVAELERELDLWNDPEFVKSQARERLGYVMPGETLYVVSDTGKGTAVEQRDSRVAEANRDRRAATPWFVTMWDSLSVAGQSGEKLDNPNNAPIVNSPSPGK